jgi:hypothetical protein
VTARLKTTAFKPKKAKVIFIFAFLVIFKALALVITYEILYKH